jgi:hypothetical protein
VTPSHSASVHVEVPAGRPQDVVTPLGVLTGVALVMMVLVAAQGLRTRKPKAVNICQERLVSETSAIACTREYRHSGMHSARYGKIRYWWEMDT